jgi:hypothetical protein
MPEPHVANFMQLHECSDILRHVNHSSEMQFVASFAHRDNMHAAATPADFVFTSTLAFVQFRVKPVTQITTESPVSQVESTPACIEAQVH